MPLPKENVRYTYHDYCQWLDDERWELNDGHAYNMTLAPTFRHLTIAGNFFRIIGNALKGKSCVPGIAPTDIVLSEWDVVQPDVFVVCDPKKITEKNIQGAPDVVFEVLSPSTAKKDRWDKRNLYEKYGVREYLLADPDGQYVERFLLGEDKLFGRGEVFDAEETITLDALPDVKIPLRDVFGIEEPKE